MQQRGSSDERVTHFRSFHDALRKGHRLDELGVTRRTLQMFSARFAFALFSCLSRICGAFGGLSREKNEFAEHFAVCQGFAEHLPVCQGFAEHLATLCLAQVSDRFIF